jgi:hypothetical protein
MYDLPASIRGSTDTRNSYTEATEYIYMLNTFDFQAPSYILLLPSSLPNHRIDLITSLRLTWTMKNDPPVLFRNPRGTFHHNTAKKDTWLHTWAALADMKGLKYLCVELVVSNLWGRVLEEAEIELVKPIRKVRVERFELVLPFRRREERKELT